MRGDTILISIRGKDTPGITSRLTAILAGDSRVRLLDIEQMVVHKKLILSILIGFSRKNHDNTPLLKELLFAANKLGVEIGFEVFDPAFLGGDGVIPEYVITCLGEVIQASHLSAISKILAANHVNIDKISKLTLEHIKAIEFLAHAKKRIDVKKLSKKLLSLSGKLQMDIAVQKQINVRRAKRVVVMDMDSTLIQSEVIEELAKIAGVLKNVEKITREAMEGKIPFVQSLKKRASLLKGIRERDFEKVYRRLRLTPGAVRLIGVLKKLGYKIALISGGFSYFTDRFHKKLGLDYSFSNRLEIKEGRITGKLIGPIVDSKRKAEILMDIARAEKISPDQVIAIGDGANDIPMLIRAGLGVAFQAKPKVREKARYSLSHSKSLDSILYLLGISEKEIKQLGH